MVYAAVVEPTRVRCMLVLADGPSRRVGPSGVLIGRQRDCDIVTRDPSASRRHALVRLTTDGVEVVPLGREPVEVNGKAIDRATALANGDTVGVPGLELAVTVVAQRPTAGAATGFVLQRERGGSFGVAHTPFVIGGGDDDDLIVKKWPAALVRLHVAQGELFVELRAGAAHAQRKCPRARRARAARGRRPPGCRDETFAIAEAEVGVTTAVAAREGAPRKVEIELLPRGGRIVFTVAAGERAVYLADRRFDLLIALLRPPDGNARASSSPTTWCARSCGRASPRSAGRRSTC